MDITTKMLRMMIPLLTWRRLKNLKVCVESSIGTSDSIQQALLKTTDVDTFTLDFKDDFELENEQIIGALIYSIH